MPQKIAIGIAIIDGLNRLRFIPMMIVINSIVYEGMLNWGRSRQFIFFDCCLRTEVLWRLGGQLVILLVKSLHMLFQTTQGFRGLLLIRLNILHLKIGGVGKILFVQRLMRWGRSSFHDMLLNSGLLQVVIFSYSICTVF
jgi:hypothetical protein